MSKFVVSRRAVFGESESIQKYMREIKNTKPLSKEAEHQLIVLAQTGDDRARSEILKNNLRFVVQVAIKYQHHGVPLEDLIGFGNIGLISSIETFDCSKNFKFITHAVWQIRAELQKAVQDHGRLIRVPAHKTKTEKMPMVSISTPTGDDEDSESYADRYLAAEPTRNDQADLGLDIARALTVLENKESQAIRLHYGIGFEYPRTVDQVADVMTLTNERARQLIRSAERKLAQGKAAKLLVKYL
jgi:RNA polymerase primary sigma factor